MPGNTTRYWLYARSWWWMQMSNTRKFEDALDECLERLLVKNETIEQCIQSFPEYADRLEPLLETALAARQMSTIHPRSEFREQARQQFKSALRETAPQKRRVSFNWGRQRGWQRGWAVALATMLVVLLAGGGTVYAAAGSMPDSPLYNVKIATEQVQLALTFSKLGKAEVNARLADKRVAEIVYLAEADKPEKIATITQNMNNHLNNISTLVSAPAEVSSFANVPAPLQTTVPETTRPPEQEPPATISPAVPTVPLQIPATSRAPFLKPQEQTANATPPVHGPGNVTPSTAKNSEKSNEADQQAKLKTTVENQANTNIARLKASLDKAPASAKPALQQAINQSETQYQKAIESLK